MFARAQNCFSFSSSYSVQAHFEAFTSLSQFHQILRHAFPRIYMPARAPTSSLKLFHSKDINETLLKQLKLFNQLMSTRDKRDTNLQEQRCCCFFAGRILKCNFRGFILKFSYLLDNHFEIQLCQARWAFCWTFQSLILTSEITFKKFMYSAFFVSFGGSELPQIRPVSVHLP